MRATIENKGHFYQAYRAKNADFGEETFACAEDTIRNIMSKATTSEHPGMLLGKVQSGKTRTFISVLTIAFDNGFDIAVILTKNSKALMQQTLNRITSEFRSFIDDGDLDIYDIMHTPGNISKFELDSKLIFIAKKQDDNLQRLIDRFRQTPGMSTKRTLIIDDEADSASVGYGRKDGRIEANKIAAKISELRSIIVSSSFLQVTATPYSLYLQPGEIDVANVVDFKPIRPAFTNLVPVPKAYVGGDTYFGDAARSQVDTVESLIHHNVDPREFDRLKRPDRRSLKLEEVLTTSNIIGYRTAIVNFIVGGCIQRLKREQANESSKKLRHSFLLHSEASKEAHDWQENVTRAITSEMEAKSRSKSPIFEDLVRISYDELSRSLALARESVPNRDAVLAAVSNAVENEYITITKVNSDDDVAALLDATGQLKLRSPLNIFIGGQVLDRGVTLAGLIGFYYGRRPNKFQQDTVLQHSRMYGYRRVDLAVTRFYTSRAIRHAMSQMEEFDASLRAAIEAGGDGAVQFIRKAQDGTVVPCSPNKILIAATQTLRPNKRILPIGFQGGHRTGGSGPSKQMEALDREIEKLCGFGGTQPAVVKIEEALAILAKIELTLSFPDEDVPPFNWDAAKAALIHLSQQAADPSERGKVLLWAAKDRNSARLAGAGSHATYIETPDSEKTEGQIAKTYAIDKPILFLLRQNGSKDKGWRDAPFYWPVIRAQRQTPTAIYMAETIG